MNDYSYKTVPAIAEISPIDAIEAQSLAVSFLANEGHEAVDLTLELLVSSIAVFHFSDLTEHVAGLRSGWVLGGRLPHLLIADEEIREPLEALAIYAYHLPTWSAAKGIDKGDNSVPIYKVPPDWHALQYSLDEVKKTKIGDMVNFIGFNLIPHNREYIKHNDIREMCVRAGWIR